MITPSTKISIKSINPHYEDRSIEDLVLDACALSTCAKSKRGVILVSPDGADFVWSINKPPKEFECSRDEWCRTNCNKVAVHAEERAIISAQCDLTGWEMFHAKHDYRDWYKIVPSGPPSCWQCSRMIVEAGIAGMWLYHEDGWKRYTAEEFHQLTLDYCFPK